MTQRLRLTRPELKRQREALRRFQRYLPMLKLRQQQLQAQLLSAQRALSLAKTAEDEARPAAQAATALVSRARGLDLGHLIAPSEIRTRIDDIAGISVPAFEGIVFPLPAYGLINTPAWVDFALLDLRRLEEKRAMTSILAERCRLVAAELLKTVQRVNLFEQVKIPEAKDGIRRIRIALGDELAASTGRAKIAKGKLIGGAA